MKYDLEERTYRFTRDLIAFTDKVPRTIANLEILKQVIRSAGSIGANYIEANECLGKKDFAMRIKISKKESKETIYWLCLLQISDFDVNKRRDELVQEATELMKILGSILSKC
ncbi:four helix bundle protein [Candidatus Uhrbacteria bacterium CG_4_9_14_0_2_um_filter_41_50]|uniref:Four helix bundle protein n=1 Tax=Candidatus Uhrbacteria bacterium CG_4_9_14_0_2_um_filter_41_50 TaxID=1975031 RepID=A0A2M8EQ75_9BACT|nr:MAG: four helix bundle protein [Candidatus Uhrbacteria bacterium CG_4_10_14_3_um_filter_41_21]PIZ54495.1 MAG: four helix bundle protein [Candidatus Uhrbacteria bacterium CG_4_10_14_0_2_um_filter_41_21]PJB84845.1 MAG: four helix bundle protein [Candidatus Uhrbacteria bacterium CG_4_9_14_0_8_um_filter_41_16]PJC24890.1 MAG: four helix bundle protein [Candidatus Uhrbacteria bacterium CG_4_9_14_0_2_um_filter_41_50]PJE75229.1 MAG: four helix bundle protein [Candidatus Uhrbacteria bacterium CG10_bi